MKIEPIQTVSIHTPIMPPNIPIMNIKKRTKVLDEVGNIYEAIKLADEPAGEVKKNMKHMKTSSQISSLMYCEIINRIPENESKT
jgi:hypothetical protein